MTSNDIESILVRQQAGPVDTETDVGRRKRKLNGSTIIVKDGKMMTAQG